MSVCRPFSPRYVSSSLHFDLLDIKRLSRTHSSASFTFGLERYSGLTIHCFLQLASDSRNPDWLPAAFYSWRPVRIAFRGLPASAMWSRNLDVRRGELTTFGRL